MLIGSVIVEALGAPWEIVNSAECKNWQDVDVSGGKEEVAEDRSDHFDVFPEREGPQHRYDMSHNNKQYQEPQDIYVDDELLVKVLVFEINKDQRGVVNQQSKDSDAINAK